MEILNQDIISLGDSIQMVYNSIQVLIEHIKNRPPTIDETYLKRYQNFTNQLFQSCISFVSTRFDTSQTDLEKGLELFSRDELHNPHTVMCIPKLYILYNQKCNKLEIILRKFPFSPKEMAYYQFSIISASDKNKCIFTCDVATEVICEQTEWQSIKTQFNQYNTLNSDELDLINKRFISVFSHFVSTLDQFNNLVADTSVVL